MRRAPGRSSTTSNARLWPDNDYVKLFELGAHPFLTRTLFIAMFESDYTEPFGFQKEYAVRLKHFSALP